MDSTTMLVLFVLTVVHAVLHGQVSCPLLSPRQADGRVDVSSFLRRAHHASAVLNKRVYIDGGEFSFQKDGNITYQYSNTLLSIDLANDWTNDSVPMVSGSKPPGAPNLRDGGIWVDRSRGVLYTGFVGDESHFGDQAVSPQGLWSFTPGDSGQGSWKNLNSSAPEWFTSQPRPLKGLVASGRGYGFLLAENDTLPQRPGMLITYDISDNEMIDTSGIEPRRGIPVFAGAAYVPNWGNRGVLIAVGALQQGWRNNNSDSFETVHVYDIDAERWFDQKTTGDIPPYRTDFCMAGAASSNRTHEVLVYAGWDGSFGSGATQYDTAHILTLPGFYWVKADYPPAHPRHALTCTPVGGSQILTIGGLDTTAAPQDQLSQPQPQPQAPTPPPLTTTNPDPYTTGFDTRDPFTLGLSIFDLSTLTFAPSFRANQPPQPPAPKFQDYYTTNGRTPQSGFSSRPMQSLFATDAFHPDDADDPASSAPGASHGHGRSSLATGAIIAGTLGGLVGLGLLSWAVGVWLRRVLRKRRMARLGLDSNGEPLQQQEGQQGDGDDRFYRGVIPDEGPRGKKKGSSSSSSSSSAQGVRLERGLSVLKGKVPGDDGRYVATDRAGRPVALYSPWTKVDGVGDDCWLREPVFEVEGDGSWPVRELEGDCAFPVEVVGDGPVEGARWKAKGKGKGKLPVVHEVEEEDEETEGREGNVKRRISDWEKRLEREVLEAKRASASSQKS